MAQPSEHLPPFSSNLSEHGEPLAHDRRTPQFQELANSLGAVAARANEGTTGQLVHNTEDQDIIRTVTAREQTSGNEVDLYEVAAELGITVIDRDEFEAAQKDPQSKKLLQEARAYYDKQIARSRKTDLGERYVRNNGTIGETVEFPKGHTAFHIEATEDSLIAHWPTRLGGLETIEELALLLEADMQPAQRAQIEFVDGVEREVNADETSGIINKIDSLGLDEVTIARITLEATDKRIAQWQLDVRDDNRKLTISVKTEPQHVADITKALSLTAAAGDSRAVDEVAQRLAQHTWI